MSMAASGVHVEVLGSWASPYSNRVQIALNLKSIPYDFTEENFYSNKSTRLLEANPVHKKVPVLFHNGKPICESMIIVQYIDDAWIGSGPSILPSDPYERAVARFWVAYIDDKWFPSFKELQHATEDNARAMIVGRIFEGVALLEEAFVKCSKGKAFFSGDNIGFLDIALGSYLGWIHVVEITTRVKVFDESKSPGLVGWSNKILSHNAVAGVMPQAEKLIEFYTMMMATKVAER